MSKVQTLSKIYFGGVGSFGIIGGIGCGYEEYKRLKNTEKYYKLSKLTKAKEITTTVFESTVISTLVATSWPVTLPVFAFSYLIN